MKLIIVTVFACLFVSCSGGRGTMFAVAEDEMPHAWCYKWNGYLSCVPK